MLKNRNLNISGRKKSELQNTPNEILRNNMMKAGLIALEESSYVASKTQIMIEVVQKAERAVDGGAVLISGSESASAFGQIASKVKKDADWGDKVYTLLCLISGTCEAVALGCSTIKAIPFRGRVYISAKIISNGCISFRNARASEGC